MTVTKLGGGSGDPKIGASTFIIGGNSGGGGVTTMLVLPEESIDLVTKGRLLFIEGYNGKLISLTDLPLGAIFLKYPLSRSSAMETRQGGIEMTCLIVY